MRQEGFSTPKICDLTGIPYGTLYHWLSTDFITPSLAKPQGRGKPARWAFQDVVAIQTAQALRQHGISLQGLRKVVSYIQTHFDVEQPLSERWLATDGHEVYLLDGDALLALLRKGGQRTLFHLVDMRQTTAELQAKVTPLRPTPRRTNHLGTQGHSGDVTMPDRERRHTNTA
jgi:MerR HTH family regulatory protein